MKPFVVIGLVAALAACQQPIPDSGAGVRGMPAGGPDIMPPVGGFSAPAPVQTGAIGAGDLAAAGIGSAQPAGGQPMNATGLGGAPMGASQGLDRFGNPMPATVGGDRAPGVQATPANAVAANNTGISDEQDFDAVAGRESIESDAARLAQQASQYQVVQPTALPQRAGDTGPNIVQYALNAPNVRGQEWYSRFAFAPRARFERNCAGYRSPDEAQRDFLARGGPERDPMGLDPDGDGFACGWDPAPFRAAMGN